MPETRIIAADYALVLRDAEKALASAKSADDVRAAWKKHNGALGHRTLGRLLMGRTSAELLAKLDGKD